MDWIDDPEIENNDQLRTAAYFLENLHVVGLDYGHGKIEIRWFEKNKGARQEFFDSPLDAAKSALELSGQGVDAYVGVNLRIGSAGKKENVQYVDALHCEVDYGIIGHKRENVYQSYQEALEAINSFRIKPNIVIHSGGGFHLYWILDKPLSVADVTAEVIEGTIKNISIAIGGDPGTQDISRILRIPGTSNWKTGKPRPVTVVDYHDSFFLWVDFQEFFPSSTNQLNAEEERPRSIRQWSGSIDDLPIKRQTKELILNGRDEGYRSEAMMTVISALTGASLSNKDIIGIFDEYPIGEKYREKGSSREKWLLPQIEKARARVTNSADDKEETTEETSEQLADSLEFPEEVMAGVAGDFASTFSEHLESPKHFFFMAFLTCLGNLLGDRIKLARSLSDLSVHYL